jgi:hypothetical protein
MANQRIKALSTGLGVGLLAATLAAPVLAGVQNSFSQPAIYYRGGTTPTYVVTVPSGNQSTDSVVLVELTLADSAKNTWSLNASVSGNIGATQGGAIVGIGYQIDSNISGVTGTASTVLSNGGTTSYGLADSATSGVVALNGVWNGTKLTWYVPGSALISQQFAGVSNIGSGTAAANCGYSYKVSLDTDGNFKVNTVTNGVSVKVTDMTLINVQSTFPAASSTVWFPSVTKTSGLAAGDWVSYNVTDIGGRDAQIDGSFTNASSIFKVGYGTTAASLGTASSSAASPFPNWPTSAAVLVNKLNSCTPVYANRVALNSSGLIIGGNNGLGRIW